MSTEFLEDTLSPWQRTIHEVLDDWFVAMEDGSAFTRIPDLSYQRSSGKPTWTDEELDALVAVAIDEYVNKQRSWIESVRKIKTDADCGFARLGPVQRLALAQDLDRVCAQFEIITGEEGKVTYPTFTPYSGIPYG